MVFLFSFLFYFLSTFACANCWLNLLPLHLYRSHRYFSVYILKRYPNAHINCCVIFHDFSMIPYLYALCCVVSSCSYFYCAPRQAQLHTVCTFLILCSVCHYKRYEMRPRRRSQFLVNSTLTYWLNAIFLWFSLFFYSLLG